MSDLLGVAGNAAAAYQLALATVSNNIANVSTDGYSRQAVDLREAAPRQLGGAYIGTGVIYDRVKRQYDAFAELNLRGSNSELASQEPMVDYTNRVVDLMGSEGAGLVSALDEFFSSSRGLTTDPASAALRGSFFRSAQGLTSRFGLISSQLDLVDTETRDAVEGTVASINTLAQQLAAVNGQLAKHGNVQSQPSELMDQRDRLLRELSQFVNVRVDYKVNGAVQVSVGSSSASKDVIVKDMVAVRIGTTTDAKEPNRIGLVLDPYGETPKSLVSVSSGKLAGLMSFREQVLDGSRNALDDIARVLMTEVNSLHSSGVDGYGQLGGDMFKVEAGAAHLAAGIKLAIDDPMRIAAAAQFRVIEAANNTGRADATVTFSAPLYGAPKDLGAVLSNNSSASAGLSFPVGGTPPLASVGSIASGLKDVTIYLSEAQGDQQLQLFTRDGRHVLGSPLNPSQQQGLLSSGGVEPGATYDASQRNLAGAQGYRGMQVFYGARAEVLKAQAFDSKDRPTPGAAIPALLEGGRLRSGLSQIAANTLKLNGVSLPALNASSNSGLTAPEVAAWLNAAGQAQGITARALNEVRAPASQLKLDRSLILNGVTITPVGSGFGSAQGLVDAINTQNASSGVQASLSPQGELVLTNTLGNEGKDIKVEPLLANGGNALNITPGIYSGRLELSRALVSGTDTPIELSFGAAGKPSDLAALGFRTAAYIKGTVPDDLLVCVTDTAAGNTARVSATYQGTPVQVASDLRANPMQITFVTPTGASPLRYQIIDTATKSVLAERDLDPAALDDGISYRGLKIAFSSMPQRGDRFMLDGNPDGAGNNDNIRAISALQSAPLLRGAKTLAGGYTDHVNQMGNLARQASIARDALTVVRDQAQEKRDQVVGVNLDEEAASLIRYQQAYQASAKVMQVASQLFDSIIQLR